MSRKIVGALALALMLPLAACDDTTNVAESGTMSLMLTDAPGDFLQAVVTIDSVRLMGEGEPVVLSDTPFTTNLLTLSNDITTLVGDAVVPGGSYSQISFVIPEACIAVEQEGGSSLVYASSGFTECGDVDGALQLPSFGESGLKIGLPGGSVDVDGDAHILLLDFDVSESFGQEAGGSGMWVMNPVIKADDISLSGTISVDLTVAEGVDLAALGSSLADFQARVSGDTEPVAFTDLNEDGTYTAEFLYLFPDTEYQVWVELQEEAPMYDFTLDPTSPQNVSLGSADQVSVAFEVTAATSAN